MRAFEYKKYHQRSSIILIPMLILAILTWSLNERVSTSLTEDVRVYIILIVRVFCLGLFAVTVALLVPVTYRMLQLTITSLSYVALVFVLTKIYPPSISSPIVCVIAAIASTIAFLPRSSNVDEIEPNNRVIQNILISFALPALVLFILLTGLTTINEFISITFTEDMGRSLFSAIYVPFFICLQVFGHQYLLNNLASYMYDEELLAAFINAITLTLTFSLPAIVLMRSFFSHSTTKLFLVLLGCFCILCGSIGSCVSIILLILFVLFPGSFLLILFTSFILFFISYNFDIGEITTISNLYHPDLNLSLINLDNDIFEVRLIQSISIIFPPFLLCVSIFLKKDKDVQRKEREGLNNIGYKVNSKSEDELQLLALIRGLGGLSNFKVIRRFEGKIFVQILDTNALSNHTLNLIVRKRIVFDRIKKIYALDFGPRSRFFEKRLKLLTEDEFNNQGVNLVESLSFNK